MNDTTMTKQILLTRQSPAYWRVTFNHPPLNIFGPETIIAATCRRPKSMSSMQVISHWTQLQMRLPH